MLPHSGQKFISPLKQDILLINERNTSTVLNEWKRSATRLLSSESNTRINTCARLNVPTAQHMFCTFNNSNFSLTRRRSVFESDDKYDNCEGIRNARASSIFVQALHRTLPPSLGLLTCLSHANDDTDDARAGEAKFT